MTNTKIPSPILEQLKSCSTLQLKAISKYCNQTLRDNTYSTIDKLMEQNILDIRSKRDPILEKKIIDTFYDNHKIYGRKRISIIVQANERTVGRYMKALGLICTTWDSNKTKRNKSFKKHFS